MGQIIRYLEPEEKEKARTLWSQAFFEDSEEFDQYYFTEKIKDNQILVKEEDVYKRQEYLLPQSRLH